MGPQADGVERISRRFDTDLRQHRVLAVFLQCEAVGQRFGDGLEGERPARIADLIDESILCRDADAEGPGDGMREFRDVVGDISALEIGKADAK